MNSVFSFESRQGNRFIWSKIDVEGWSCTDYGHIEFACQNGHLVQRKRKFMSDLFIDKVHGLTPLFIRNETVPVVMYQLSHHTRIQSHSLLPMYPRPWELQDPFRLLMRKAVSKEETWVRKEWKRISTGLDEEYTVWLEAIVSIIATAICEKSIASR